MNLRTLSPFQRALLVIDGTVTKFIEAYTMEPLDVVHLAHDVRPLEEKHAWLAAPAGTEVAARQVMIQGRYTHTLYVYAVAVVVLERLPEGVAARLEKEGEGLGRALNEAEIETRREILWFGRERPPQLPQAVEERGVEEFVSRTYRIIARGKPVALINERFPYGLDNLPSHH